MCEIIASGALIFNMYLMHWTFNDFWISYKPAITSLWNGDVIAFTRNAALLFPTQAKCFYHDFGPSGGLNERDALCFLPQNIINEKIFVFFYIWFLFMLLCVVTNLIYIIVMLVFKCLRKWNLRHMIGRRNVYNSFDFYSRYGDVGYWFAIRLLNRNLSPVLFDDLISELMTKSRKYYEEFTQTEIPRVTAFASEHKVQTTV
jgi:innexin